MASETAFADAARAFSGRKHLEKKHKSGKKRLREDDSETALAHRHKKSKAGTFGEADGVEYMPAVGAGSSAAGNNESEPEAHEKKKKKKKKHKAQPGNRADGIDSVTDMNGGGIKHKAQPEGQADGVDSVPDANGGIGSSLTLAGENERRPHEHGTEKKHRLMSPGADQEGFPLPSPESETEMDLVANGDGGKMEEKKKKKKKEEEEEEGKQDNKIKAGQGGLEADANGNDESSRKKKKKDKKGKGDKKRETHTGGLEPDDAGAPTEANAIGNDEDDTDHDDIPRKHKKKAKKEGRQGRNENSEPSASPEPVGAEDGAQHKKEKKKKKKTMMKKQQKSSDAVPPSDPMAAFSELMDANSSSPLRPPVSSSEPCLPDAHEPAQCPSRPQFPFFTRTFSLYRPIYPSGWGDPVRAAEEQHLRPLVNRYVPEFGGVLLGYRNVALNDRPGREGAATCSSESSRLLSIGEYAVGFGWVTVEAVLFIPSRGAWMEGNVVLQSEGHVGVVCWGKFNASVESRRLPDRWRWVSADSPEAAAYAQDGEVGGEHEHQAEAGSFCQPGDVLDEGSHADNQRRRPKVRQMHSTGFWVDGDGDRVAGRLRFRIRNFDVGMSGDHGFLSLQGTMLDGEAEKALLAEERQEEIEGFARRGGFLARSWRAIPEFSLTRFGSEEEEEKKAKQE